MVSIPKIIGIISGGFVLCVSLSDVSQARHRLGSDPCVEGKGPGIQQCGVDRRQGVRTITGECYTLTARNFSSSSQTARK